MKSDIHPVYSDLKVVCSCGNTFETRSAVGKAVLNIEICSACHPFYTGKQKIVDTAGRVERFQKRYSAAKVAPVAAKPSVAVSELPAARAKKTSIAKSSSTAKAAKPTKVAKAATKPASK